MLYVLTETWPGVSSVEVAKESVRLLGMPLSSYMKMIGPFVVMGGDGMKCYTVYEVEKGQADKALSEIAGRLAGLFRIPGYRASLEVAITPAEALPLVGLSL